MSSCHSTLEEIRKFAKMSKCICVQFVGFCSGNAHYIPKEIAAVYKKPAPVLNSKYSSEIEKHFIFEDKKKKNDPYYTQTYKKKESLRDGLIGPLFEHWGLVFFWYYFVARVTI